ncbi:MAG: encapsulin-associated ferritin-like protein [Spirochaetales bacterium]
MSQYHEPTQELSAEVRDYVRALVSLKEEVEAVDWYSQRQSVSKNTELVSVLRHNMEEEMEHAAMTLEWLRRNMSGWDEALRTYLFTNRPLLEVEEEAEGEESSGAATSLGIGQPKKE